MDMKFQLTQVHQGAIFDTDENITKAVKLSLWLPLADQQLIELSDAR